MLVWRILGGWGFAVQKPDCHAIERAEQGVQVGKHKARLARDEAPSAKGD
ncbi:MAG: hypothetical protein MUF08_10320 [Burkholderiaceae bacterium]|jgi:transposase|nr:hypothetical protein [Burkholderiaceae bacterium]MCU0965427.1 hypothetical protein [Burkholderiaceae bacterium]